MKQSPYIHVQDYSLEEIFELINDHKHLDETEKIDIIANNHFYSISFSTRLKWFVQSHVCENCGKTAHHFTLDQQRSGEGTTKAHFNMYAEDGDLFSAQRKDIKIGRSLTNLITLCESCLRKWNKATCTLRKAKS